LNQERKEYQPSVRAQIVTRRTYNRPLNKEGTRFETWADTCRRVKDHQSWLWERALGVALSKEQNLELDEFEQLMLDRKASVSGRTLWLGGTDIAKRREASQFNCAFTKVETIHDVVDCLWLLLQGCGVGFKPVVGTLSGFTSAVKDVKILPSKRTEKGGHEANKESYNPNTRTWTLSVGDSAEAWAKSIGKILAYKGDASTVVLDFREIRPAGERLAGYGWISSGDSAIARAYTAIVHILSKKSGQLLNYIDLLDVMNHLGTVLSSRRSAELCLMEYGSPQWERFARAKDHLAKTPHRQQSNNSLLFLHKPSLEELTDVFRIITESGGSEPGLINGEAARVRAPWFSGPNPCVEILLVNKGFCNLVEFDVGKFHEDNGGMERTVYLIARANYRQTLVNLDDGILQRTWHENNEYLRLCGVGPTGIVRRQDMTAYDYKKLKNIAIHGAYSMADELGTQRPKNVTCVKPSGTLSKIMDTTEGAHVPIGKYIFNRVNFSVSDPMVDVLRTAGYEVKPNPSDDSNILVTLPIAWHSMRFKDRPETAVEQLERYKMLMLNYVEQNCSISIHYFPEEVESIINWLHTNWDTYVGVSFMPRGDAVEAGYAYLPQEAVSKKVYDEYVSKLLPVNLEKVTGIHEIEDDSDCATGVCPVK
jgi:ribonucleoside-triphosphate reductase (formate)